MSSSRSPLGGPIGIESDVVDIVPSTRVVHARLRIDNSESSTPFSAGDWLTVAVSLRLFSLDDARRGKFDSPVAAGPEMVVRARSDSWTPIELELPRVVRQDYAVTAKVFSADDRYRLPFKPSNCRVVRTNLGEQIVVDRRTLAGVYRPGGFGNPAAEEEIRRLVRLGAVIAFDGSLRFRATEDEAGSLKLLPLAAP